MTSKIVEKINLKSLKLSLSDYLVGRGSQEINERITPKFQIIVKNIIVLEIM